MQMTSTLDAERRPQLLVLGLMGLIVVLWTAVENLPLVMTGHYSLYQIVWTRYATHLVVMLVILGPRRFFHFVRTNRLKLQVGRGIDAADAGGIYRGDWANCCA